MRYAVLIMAMGAMGAAASAEPPEVAAKAGDSEKTSHPRRVSALDADAERRKSAEAKKQATVEQLKADVARLEVEKSTASKSGKPRLANELTKHLKLKRQQLQEAESKTIEQCIADTEAEADALQREKRAKAIEAAQPPLKIVATGITPNAIGIPRLGVHVTNTKAIPIEAYEIDVECFDRFGDPVTWPGKGNFYRGIFQETIPAKETARGLWTLHLHQNTAQAKLWISRIKLSDGTVWEQSRSAAVEGGNLVAAKQLE
jgi:hypothetical protein